MQSTEWRMLFCSNGTIFHLVSSSRLLQQEFSIGLAGVYSQCIRKLAHIMYVKLFLVHSVITMYRYLFSHRVYKAFISIDISAAILHVELSNPQLEAWIGGYREESDKAFSWSDGTSFQYTNWADGKPTRIRL